MLRSKLGAAALILAVSLPTVSLGCTSFMQLRDHASCGKRHSEGSGGSGSNYYQNHMQSSDASPILATPIDADEAARRNTEGLQKPAIDPIGVLSGGVSAGGREILRQGSDWAARQAVQQALQAATKSLATQGATSALRNLPAPPAPTAGPSGVTVLDLSLIEQQ